MPVRFLLLMFLLLLPLPERRRALLYANPGLAQRHMDKLKAKM